VHGVGFADGVARSLPHGVSQRSADTHDRRVDRTHRDRAAEDLADHLGDLAVRHPLHPASIATCASILGPNAEP